MKRIKARGCTIITPENYKQFLSLDVAAFSLAAGGAMGDSGGVEIITMDGSNYYMNYVYGDHIVTVAQMNAVLPMLPECQFPIIGTTDRMPSAWKHIPLGFGNNLTVREEFYEPLVDAWVEYSETEEGRENILYGVWEELMLEILAKKTRAGK